MATKETIQDLRSTCQCANIEFCPLAKLVENMADRLCEQVKCIDVMKKKASEKAGHDIGWNAACFKWVDEGYAKVFAEVWHEGVTHKELCAILRERLCKEGEDCI